MKEVLYSIATNRKWADRILEAKWLMDRHAEYDYVLFDEGCIQFFSSLEAEEEEAEKGKEVLNTEVYQHETIVFDCDIDTAENIRRLKTRNKNGDRFLSSDNDLMIQKLTRKRQLISRALDYEWTKLSIIPLKMGDVEEAITYCLERVKR